MAHFGAYTILRRLAVGGMAEVFLARREGPAGVAKVVALKRILPHLSEDPGFVAMFLNEARIASRLSHPNIVQLHDFGEVDGAYFLAMEYVPGEDLLTLLRRNKEQASALPPTLVAFVLACACEALHHAHELCDEQDRPLHVVHRDVTPSNLLIAYDGTVKLADFGIAKVDRGTRTVTGSPKGKVPYMSPEQVLAHKLDRRSDLFSLAVVGHELLTGERLFHRENDLLLLKAITEERIAPPRERRPEVPERLEQIIMMALERDRESRFATAQAMQLELEAFLAEHGGIGWKLELSRYMHALFGEEVAADRRRSAAGEVDDGEPTRALEPATRTRSRRPARRQLAIAALAGTLLGAGSLAIWSARSQSDAADRSVAGAAPPVLQPAVPDVTTPPPAPPAVPVSPPTPAPPRPPTTSSRAAPTKPTSQAATGNWAYLSVDRSVPLRASLDDHPLGTTPIAHKRIKPGAHTLVLHGSDGNRVTTRFVVRAGEEHEELHPLQRGSLTCDAVPWAEVYIGPRKLGLTPLPPVPLMEGNYTLRLTNPDLHAEKMVPITVRAGETVRVKATFP